MKRLLDPFDSLGPARKALATGYSVALGISFIWAIFCLFFPFGGSMAILPVVFCGLRKRPYLLLGVDPDARTKWTDPLLSRISFALAATLVACCALIGYLAQFDHSHPAVFGIKPSHVGLALMAAFAPPFLAVIHLRRLSWLAAHRSTPVDPMAVWQ